MIPAVLVLAAAAGVLAFFLTRSSQPDPSFVPDSQTSFFFLARDNPTQAELWRGTEQVLTLPAEDVVFRSAAGSMDKSVLLLVDAGGTLYRADSVGCTTLSEQVLYCALSGDGSTSAWVTAAGQLWLQRNEEAPVLVADGVSPYSVLLSYGGHTLAWQTASDSDGSSHLCLMLDSGALQELPPEDAAAALVTDSGTLYYTVLDGDMLSLYVWRDGTSTLLTDRLLPFGTTLACNRDGTELLYMTEEDDGPVTWFCQEGEEPRSIGSFAFQSLCSPAFSSSSYIDTDHLSVWLYNTDTLRQKCLRTDQNVWLLDSNGDASPLFPDGSTITSAYVSQDGTSLVVQTTGVSEKNTLYRFDNLWGDLESQELDHGHELSLLGASPDLSLLLYTCLDTDLVRTYYALKAGGEPVLLTQGNEFAVLTADNTVLCSTGDSTGLLFSDGGEPIPLEVPGTEDGDAFITVAGVGNLTCVTAYTIADLATSALSPVDVYTVSPDGALTLLTEDILYLYAY
ncbi:hypothetical protein BACCAP_02870 [Pseudoflavonifractor capillosus ATCC 29799]|uniref:Uncharacterized protein n=1 Tax=Pseudoflavonifractor capillosus ATCC 29799 TaxID=411467 RepID=A6NXC4_9FIRM|nr:hypothetical protein BACCAP_02870 [Pseudoflavonifractor capillosus ATCC 29799]